MMMNKAGDYTTMDYVAQVIIALIIIVDIVFLISGRKKKIVNKKHLYMRVQILLL